MFTYKEIPHKPFKQLDSRAEKKLKNREREEGTEERREGRESERMPLRRGLLFLEVLNPNLTILRRKHLDRRTDSVTADPACT